MPLLARYASPPSSVSLADAFYSSLMLLLVSLPASDFAAACFLLLSCGSLPRPLLRRCADVKTLTDGDDVISSLAPAFERYNEKQLATVKLPGASQEVGCHGAGWETQC